MRLPRHLGSRAIVTSMDRFILRASEYLAARAQRGRTARYRDLHSIKPEAQLLPECVIENLSGRPGAISIGSNTAVRAELLVMRHGGAIQVGEWCYLGAGSRLWSARAITIGNRVLISHGVEVHDWNAHSLDARMRHRHFQDIIRSGHPMELDNVDAGAVLIDDDAWIGFGSTVMKGVTIGRGAVVAARSLVLESVPPWTLVAGHPARPIRHLQREDD